MPGLWPVPGIPKAGGSLPELVFYPPAEGENRRTVHSLRSLRPLRFVSFRKTRRRSDTAANVLPDMRPPVEARVFFLSLLRPRPLSVKPKEQRLGLEIGGIAVSLAGCSAGWPRSISPGRRWTRRKRNRCCRIALAPAIRRWQPRIPRYFELDIHLST